MLYFSVRVFLPKKNYFCPSKHVTYGTIIERGTKNDVCVVGAGKMCVGVSFFQHSYYEFLCVNKPSIEGGSSFFCFSVFFLFFFSLGKKKRDKWNCNIISLLVKVPGHYSDLSVLNLRGNIKTPKLTLTRKVNNA
jgi:hypothetical protein